MKKITFATVVSSAFAALAIGLAGPGLGGRRGQSVRLCLAPCRRCTRNASSGGANPYTPYGVDPYVPYGVWAQH